MNTTNTNALYKNLYETDEQVEVLKANLELCNSTRERDFIVEKICLIQELEITPTIDELEKRGEIFEHYFGND